jgi:dihydroorotate dehydrogenase
MPDLYPIIRPILFRLPTETASGVALRAVQLRLSRFLLGAAPRAPDDPILRQRIWEREFPNPLGLAAGCDKDAHVPNAMLALGFGFVEVGTVTPRPQLGNPKPRLFRLDEDRAVINRLGFNSEGLDAVATRLARRGRRGIVGINLGKNRDSRDAVQDYEEGIRKAAPFADYIVINISSPNTPGLRELQSRAPLEKLLRRLIITRNETGAAPPLLLKIAPDLTPAECADIAEMALKTHIDGLIISNTTTRRPSGLRSRHRLEAGGLSGRPLGGAATQLVADMYRLTKGTLPLIGVGGVDGAAAAYEKIRAGASLVQLYTALAFEGPALIARIKAGLVEALKRDGFTSVTQAVGASQNSERTGFRKSGAARLCASR